MRVRVPLAAGAAGKAILAHLPDSILEALPLSKYTDRTPLNRTEIRKGLELVRERGWALGDGERIPDGYGVAVPYFAENSVAGSITATIPRHRADELSLETLTAQLSAIAGAVTQLLSA
ncbi:IclR family transcriptional regulator C-terminal domain-containing protein [Streptomyces sp. NPDC005794]|uniref:IclR family transcriptional regulator domain-containing protein n=1 Tax=Streptomyces sp. NPDC005794 TaxID=3364733 RepID=UPI0036985635